VLCDAAGSWSAVAFWAELQLFGDIHYTTQGTALPAVPKSTVFQQYQK
jgi:hypothetical protein